MRGSRKDAPGARCRLYQADGQAGLLALPVTVVGALFAGLVAVLGVRAPGPGWLSRGGLGWLRLARRLRVAGQAGAAQYEGELVALRAGERGRVIEEPGDVGVQVPRAAARGGRRGVPRRGGRPGAPWLLQAVPPLCRCLISRLTHGLICTVQGLPDIPVIRAIRNGVPAIRNRADGAPERSRWRSAPDRRAGL
jgi:hypothetical protein